MKKKLVYSGILLVSTVVLSGCLKTRSDLGGGSKQEMREQLVNMQEAHAQQTVRFQDYDQQLRDLRNRIDVLENELNQARSQESQSLSKEELQRVLDERLKAYEEALSKLDQQVRSLSAQRTSSSTKAAHGGADQLYVQAEQAFDKKNWKKAIVEYQKYRDASPKGKKYADATYKIGVCFQELGMKGEAKSFFQEVIDKFPKSREAKKAEYRLKHMS